MIRNLVVMRLSFVPDVNAYKCYLPHAEDGRVGALLRLCTLCSNEPSPHRYCVRFLRAYALFLFVVFSLTKRTSGLFRERDFLLYFILMHIDNLHWCINFFVTGLQSRCLTACIVLAPSYLLQLNVRGRYCELIAFCKV